jgi:hypothetical protein
LSSTCKKFLYALPLPNLACAGECGDYSSPLGDRQCASILDWLEGVKTMFVESYRYGHGEASYPVNLPGLSVNATNNVWDYPEQTIFKLFIMMAGLLILCGLAAL